MEISTQLKNFIEQNASLLEEENWSALYEKLYIHTDKIPTTAEFTECLYEADIDPLVGMQEVPEWFLAKSKLFYEFTVPEGIRIIGRGAFADSFITTIILPEGLTGIGKEAFGGASFTHIDLPKSCKGLGIDAFMNSKLQSIDLSHVSRIGEGCFQDCPELETVILGPQLQIIQDYSFSGCTKLNRLVLPASIKKVTRWAFRHSSIKELVIENPTITLEEGVLSNANIEHLEFKGTTDQWRALKIYPEPISEVHCLDGVVI